MLEAAEYFCRLKLQKEQEFLYNLLTKWEIYATILWSNIYISVQK